MNQNPYRLEAFQNDAALAQAAVENCLSLIASSPTGRPFTMALSGGRIARRFFSAMTRAALARKATPESLSPQPAGVCAPSGAASVRSPKDSRMINPPSPLDVAAGGSARALEQQHHLLDSVHFFWADERCVPPTDPESNFLIARQLLFDPLQIHEAQVHRIRGELAPGAAASEAAVRLRGLACVNESGQPVLDLVLLGMGEDGHVASLFPGETPEAMSSQSVYRAVTASKPPPHRITLGYAVMAAARAVWVLASGAGKEEALRASLRAGGTTPLARVIQARRHTVILTDIGAS